MSAVGGTGRASVDAAHDDYLRFCDGVRRMTGIDLRQYKRLQMERRIRAFCEREGHESLHTYMAALSSDRDALHALLDRITINVSQLFRNPEQWKLLAEQVIPELVRATGRIEAWSAGCSYGAEAYSLAAICRDVAPGAEISIRGSDIDERVLAAAREGWFSREDARSAPAAVLKRWFVPDRGGWLASSSLTSAVSFRKEDLLQVRPRAGQYNLVLCRNVVIYFTDDARDEVHATLARACAAGGYVVIGSTERIALPPDQTGLRTAWPFVYRKDVSR